MNTKPIIKNIVGAAYWTTLLGAARPGYDPDIKKWTIDVVPTAAMLSSLQTWGLGAKIKDDDKNSHGGGRFIKFERLEFKKGTTTPNTPVTVLDADGNPWDQANHIGNGSMVDVKFSIYDFPAKGRFPAGRGMAILEVKVLEHTPYVPKDAVVDETVAQSQLRSDNDQDGLDVNGKVKPAKKSTLAKTKGAYVDTGNSDSETAWA